MRRVDKPWGYELIWAETADYVGKILHIDEGEQLSLQYHEIKEETLYCQSGRMELEIGDEGAELATVIMEPGDAQHITPRKVHRMRALSDCDIFEVSTPHLDDVVRLDDRYGRKTGD
jgi:mannose-6-phosphate isomerase-like protein (cupin superfamily)